MRGFKPSPVMIGSVTTLIVVVCVYLAYNANQGLPFVPAYRVAVDVPNAARVVTGNEVRIGGNRVGVVESLEVVEADNPERAGASDGSGPEADEGTTVARLNLKLDKTAEPLPKASAFRVRYRSSFGLKYLEIVRGSGPPAEEGFVFSGVDDGAVCSLPDDQEQEWEELEESAQNGCFGEQTEFDDINNTFDDETRASARRNLVGYGGGFAGRGTSLNEAITNLEPLFRGLRPVARILASPETNMRRFWRELGDAARIVSPVAVEQAELFVFGARVFAAMTEDPQALRETITETMLTFESGIDLLPAQRRFMDRFALLSRELRPGVRDLRATLPVLNEAIEVGTPVLEHSPEINRKLRRALLALERLLEQRSTTSVLRRLRETFDMAAPLADFVVPAQTACNYWNYWFTHLPAALTDRDQVGHTFRQVLVSFPQGAEAPMNGYSGIPSNGRRSLDGEFRPYEFPIQHTHPYQRLGRGSPPDCQVGQYGYPLGHLRVPGQSPGDPGNRVTDLPGSRGPTTVFWDADRERSLADTRVPSRQPRAWRGLNR